MDSDLSETSMGEVSVHGMHMEPGRTSDRQQRMSPSGTLLDPSTLTEDQICWEDIAHHLANICRYGGGVLTRWTVAEHVVTLARVVRLMGGCLYQQLAALIHDFPEAYIGDMIRPLKHLAMFAEFCALDRSILVTVASAAGLPEEWIDDPIVKKLDSDILVWEMAMFRDQKRPAMEHADAAAAVIELLDALLEEIADCLQDGGDPGLAVTWERG